MATLASGTELVSRVGSQRSAFNGAPLRPADALRSMRASRVRSCHVARAVIADASSSVRFQLPFCESSSASAAAQGS